MAISTGGSVRVCELLARDQIPVIVREVSFGMPAETAARLAELGVAGVDTGGGGGNQLGQGRGAGLEQPAKPASGRGSSGIGG